MGDNFKKLLSGVWVAQCVKDRIGKVRVGRGPDYRAVVERVWTEDMIWVDNGDWDDGSGTLIYSKSDGTTPFNIHSNN